MKDFLKRIKLNEATISTGLGVVIVVVVVVLLVNYFRSINKTQKGETSSLSTSLESLADMPATTSAQELPAEYVTKAGDTLWAIAEKTYGSGYNWVDIAAANKATVINPDRLLVGTKLMLPKAEVKKVEPAKVQSYTVVSGDHLWSIATRLCNSGYTWPKISSANRLKNPNHIEVGQVLRIVCQ